MDALTTAVASSDDAALQSSPKKSPPESESDNEASTDVNDVSVVPVEEEQPTKNIIDEGDDRKSLYHDLLQAPPKPTNPSTKIKEPKFPMKLHMILSDPTYEHIISWLPHGRSWLIHDQKAFEQKVIPLFFRHGKFSSFARQVNGWGFIRVSHGPDMGSYYHEKFLSGMPHLCKKMKRLTSQDFVARKNGERERTPNFKAPSRRKPVRKGPVVKDYPGISDASFMARRPQMVRQGDLMAGPGTVPPMGMAGMGYPNGDVQDSILNSMQLGGAPNDPNMQMQNMQMQNMQMQNMQANMQMQNMQLQMQNNILMRQFLAANMGGNPLGGVAPNFGASIGMQGMGGALNFGAPNGMQGMGGTPNFGAPNGMQGMGGAPNFGVPNGMQGMGGAPTSNFGASIGMQGMGGTPNFGAPNGMQGMGGAPNYGAPNGLQGMGGTPNLGGPSGMGNWYG